jgi:hypothetical protein
MLPVSLDCPFLIAPFVSSAQFCLCLWIFHSVLPLLCVLPNVAYVSGLSILDCPLIKNGQSRDICNIVHQTQKGQSKMDNPETQATLGTRHRRGNQEWTIQRHRHNKEWVCVCCPMLPMSLDCPFLMAPFVSSAQCCLCLWIVHSWFPLLCLVPNVACVSG